MGQLTRRWTLCILALVCLTGLAWAAPPTLTVDGRPMQLPAPLKFVSGQGYLVIAVEFFQHLGIEPQWHAPTQTISGSKWTRTAWFTMGADKFKISLPAGPVRKAARPKARLVGTSPYIPLKPCAQAFGYKLKWNTPNKTINLVTPTKEIVEGSFLAYYPQGMDMINIHTYVGDAQASLYLESMPPPFITRTNLTTGQCSEVAMTEIQQGDHIKAHRTPGGNVWKFEAEYQAIRGTIVSVSADNMVLRHTAPTTPGSATLVQEGRYTFGPQAMGLGGSPPVIDESGHYASLHGLSAGMAVTIIINPHTRHLWCVDLRPAMIIQPKPQDTTVTIQNP